MEKNLYIDASHPNETRVVLKSKDNIEDYEYEGSKNNLIKNNIKNYNPAPALHLRSFSLVSMVGPTQALLAQHPHYLM